MLIGILNEEWGGMDVAHPYPFDSMRQLIPPARGSRQPNDCNFILDPQKKSNFPCEKLYFCHTDSVTPCGTKSQPLRSSCGHNTFRPCQHTLLLTPAPYVRPTFG